MYKHFKTLTISTLVFSIIYDCNAMNNSIKQHEHLFMKIINKDNENNTNKFIAYNPYLINSPVPTFEDMSQFMKIKELNITSNNVQKCFKYLQRYDHQNCLLLDNLLKGIYSIAEKISIVDSPINHIVHEKDKTNYSHVFLTYLRNT